MNKSVSLGAAVLTATGLLLASPNSSKGDRGVRTVESVDLKRYAGKWYEISRYPNRFQRECGGHVTAEYVLREDGRIDVLNSCRKSDGKLKQSRGKAKVADKRTNSKLKVTFFWPFYGDYWILDLGKEYEYAVVGEPERKYLWILSRTPAVGAEEYEGILKRLREQGFDTSRLIATRQGTEE